MLKYIHVDSRATHILVSIGFYGKKEKEKRFVLFNIIIYMAYNIIITYKPSILFLG